MSSSRFITNQEQILAELFNNILPTTREMDFLVGYFYFSGFEEFYRNLEGKKLRILVGMDIQRDLRNKIIEYELIDDVVKSRGQIKQEFNKSLVDIFNDTSFFDSKEKKEAFKIFLSMIKNGDLEIRKTLKSNHAKLYIFHKKTELSEGGTYPGTVITGSSNLTKAGLKTQFELNMIFRDEPTFIEAKRIFEDLWKNGITIVEKNTLPDFYSQVVDKIWLEKLPKPFLMFLRVLIEYFSVDESKGIKLPAEITRRRYLNLKYQSDAISQAINTINKHNGVIIADVVGLGKSIIASAIAYNLGMRTIIIAPPHLLQQWDDYRFDFNFPAKIYSSGKIEDALNDNMRKETQLVIIDEAHKYRNESTTDYANLQKLCVNNKVMLLTATPFNNRPQDIFSMIKLFQIPAKTTLQTVDNLSYQFRELIKEYKKIRDEQKKMVLSENQVKSKIEKLADKIRDILSPLVIRRSRIDLIQIEEYKKDLKAQKIEFPKVNPPEILDYELGEISDLYLKTLEKIAPEDPVSGFIGARYKPALYLKDIEKYKERISKEMNIDENLLKQSQTNLADFMKRLLVHRFESSVFAFKRTLDNMINSINLIKDWYENLGKVPIYKKGKLPDPDSIFSNLGIYSIDELDEFNFENELANYFQRGLLIIEKKELKKEFIKDIEKDLLLLNEIKSLWFNNGMPYDPKIEAFKKILSKKLEENPKRKIVVFSEYADTAEYVGKSLECDFRVFTYTGNDSSSLNKRKIRRNFDAGLDPDEQDNDYDILVATDAISEGYNLHRAGIIFNYDIPYNPTRVIQRVGRINRINKKMFDELFIYNFFPTATGETEIRTKGISTLKISMIHALIGEDTKYLTDEEELRSYFVEQYNTLAKEENEKASWDVHYRNLLNNFFLTHKDIIKEAKALPKRVRIRRTVKKDKSGVLVFGRKGSEYIFKLGENALNIVSLSAKDGMKLFEAEISEDSLRESEDFDVIYQEVLKQLFIRKKAVALDKGKTDAINKIEYFISSQPAYKDYFEDLKTVTKEYDALNEGFLKLIRQIDTNPDKKDLEELMIAIPHDYLTDIIKKAESIDDAVETVILAEELI